LGAITMITLEKLRTYQEFNGDIDGWARASNGKVKSLMTDADWFLIDELLMGLAIVGTGLASPHFVHEIESKVLTSAVDEATRNALRALAVQQGQNNAA
jgi:hypothetical protein